MEKKNTIITCKTKKRKISNIVSSSIDKDLSVILKNVIPRHEEISELTPQSPKKSNKTLVVELGKTKANKYIFYYASNEKKQNTSNCLKLLNKSIAYKGFNNFGVTKTNSDGRAILRFICPSPYKENQRLYVSHVHFLIQESDLRWEEQLYTLGVICSVDSTTLNKLIKNNCALVLNSSSLNDYIDKHIPGSFPLPSSISKNDSEIKKYIRSLISSNKSLKTKFERSKINLFEVPLIIYCNETGCKSTDQLLNRLWKIGFKNLRIYSGTI